MALSLVMMSCEGMSITCSFMFILAPTRSMTGHEDVQAGAERARVAAEVLDRVVVALGHHLDRGPQRRDRQHDQQQREGLEAEWVHGISPAPENHATYLGTDLGEF